MSEKEEVHVPTIAEEIAEIEADDSISDAAKQPLMAAVPLRRVRQTASIKEQLSDLERTYKDQIAREAPKPEEDDG